MLSYVIVISRSRRDYTIVQFMVTISASRLMYSPDTLIDLKAFFHKSSTITQQCLKALYAYFCMFTVNLCLKRGALSVGTIKFKL